MLLGAIAELLTISMIVNYAMVLSNCLVYLEFSIIICMNFKVIKYNLWMLQFSHANSILIFNLLHAYYFLD